jgi:hypothetical protein
VLDASIFSSDCRNDILDAHTGSPGGNHGEAPGELCCVQKRCVATGKVYSDTCHPGNRQSTLAKTNTSKGDMDARLKTILVQLNQRIVDGVELNEQQERLRLELMHMEKNSLTAGKKFRPLVIHCFHLVVVYYVLEFVEFVFLYHMLTILWYCVLSCCSSRRAARSAPPADAPAGPLI